MRAKIIAILMIAFCLLLPAAAGAQAHDEGAGLQRPVQAFDVTAGKVVKSVANTKEYQAFAKKWLASVTGLAPQLTTDDKCGYVFRIPLDQPATVRTTGLNVQTSDVFLFYCPDKPQLLLIFDENRRPYLLKFTADIKPFLRTIGIS